MSTDPMTRMERGIRITNGLLVIGVITTAFVVIGVVSDLVEGKERIRCEQALFTAWTLGPPCWFALQNNLWPPAPNGYERFRVHQALVKAVWAGVAAFIAAIMFGRWG